MRNIMVATDGSDSATRAVDIAAEIAKAVSGTLSIVTVGGTLSAKQQEDFTQVEGDSARPAEILARRNLDDAVQRAQQAGTATRSLLAWGDPTQAIMESIRHENADAIVVGRRGHGQLSGLLLGSVSQKLCGLAPCIVIVVP